MALLQAEAKPALDAYLEIAERVLLAARRPLTAKAILAAAYRAGIVPHHLFGKTQHKTLQARLSEDILSAGNESRFFRTEPGRFFVAALEADPSVPSEYKERFAARRRTRELLTGPALAIRRRFVERRAGHKCEDWTSFLAQAEDENAISYVDPKEPNPDYVLVWAFPVVRKREYLLTYRIGRYRDIRTAFANKSTVGFPSLVASTYNDLFSGDDLGASECALTALLTDLDVSRAAFMDSDSELPPPPASVMLIARSTAEQASVVLAMEWQCPDWFEPTARRLSLNDLHWMNASHSPNNLDDFEPWSIAYLQNCRNGSNKRRDARFVQQVN